MRSLQQTGRCSHPIGMNHIRLAVTATALVVASVVALVFVANGSPRPSTVRVVPADGVSQPASQPTPASRQSPLVQLAAFTCGASTVPTQAAGPTGLVSAMRTG